MDDHSVSRVKWKISLGADLATGSGEETKMSDIQCLLEDIHHMTISSETKTLLVNARAASHPALPLAISSADIVGLVHIIHRLVLSVVGLVKAKLLV